MRNNDQKSIVESKWRFRWDVPELVDSFHLNYTADSFCYISWLLDSGYGNSVGEWIYHTCVSSPWPRFSSQLRLSIWGIIFGWSVITCVTDETVEWKQNAFKLMIMRFLWIKLVFREQFRKNPGCQATAILIFHFRQAWQALGDMDKETAMKEFVKNLNKFSPSLKPYIIAYTTQQQEEERQRLVTLLRLVMDFIHISESKQTM